MPVKGFQLKADNFRKYSDEISLYNILSPDFIERLSYAADESKYGDGRFTLLTKGSEIPFLGMIDSDSEYDLLIFIRDGGRFDIDKTVNGCVVGQIVVQHLAFYHVIPVKKSGGCSVDFSKITWLLIITLFINKIFSKNIKRFN